MYFKKTPPARLNIAQNAGYLCLAQPKDNFSTTSAIVQKIYIKINLHFLEQFF